MSILFVIIMYNNDMFSIPRLKIQNLENIKMNVENADTIYRKSAFSGNCMSLTFLVLVAQRKFQCITHLVAQLKFQSVTHLVAQLKFQCITHLVAQLKFQSITHLVAQLKFQPITHLLAQLTFQSITHLLAQLKFQSITHLVTQLKFYSITQPHTCPSPTPARSDEFLQFSSGNVLPEM